MFKSLSVELGNIQFSLLKDNRRRTSKPEATPFPNPRVYVSLSLSLSRFLLFSVVFGHSGDARVVADDSGQGDPGQRLLLLAAEHTSVLPPKPAWGYPRMWH